MANRIRKITGKKPTGRQAFKEDFVILLLSIGLSYLVNTKSLMALSFINQPNFILVGMMALVLFAYSPFIGVLRSICFDLGLIAGKHMQDILSMNYQLDQKTIVGLVIVIVVAIGLWYSKGKGQMSEILAGASLGFLLVYGLNIALNHLAISSLYDLVLLVVGGVLLYQNMKQMAMVVLYGFLFYFPYKIMIIPGLQMFLG